MDATPKEIINWEGIKALGIPYERTHVWRLMRPTIRRVTGCRIKGTYKEWVEPNKNRFPSCFKLNDFRGSPPVWWKHEVIAWLENRAKLAMK
jgi:hypothetical protein